MMRRLSETDSWYYKATPVPSLLLQMAGQLVDMEAYRQDLRGKRHPLDTRWDYIGYKRLPKFEKLHMFVSPRGNVLTTSPVDAAIGVVTLYPFVMEIDFGGIIWTYRYWLGYSRTEDMYVWGKAEFTAVNKETGERPILGGLRPRWMIQEDMV